MIKNKIKTPEKITKRSNWFCLEGFSVWYNLDNYTTGYIRRDPESPLEEPFWQIVFKDNLGNLKVIFDWIVWEQSEANKILDQIFNLIPEAN